jgi:two-component system, cell cycle response regulator DivK
MTMLKILHVEDVYECRRLVEAVLKHKGYEVFQAENGEEALQVAREAMPDLVLMDFNLPDMEGDEITRRIKALPGLENVPVIVVSATDKPTEIERIREAGCCGFLQKPFSPSQLSDTVYQHLGQHLMA